jgi:hypothetical protein
MFMRGFLPGARGACPGKVPGTPGTIVTKCKMFLARPIHKNSKFLTQMMVMLRYTVPFVQSDSVMPPFADRNGIVPVLSLSKGRGTNGTAYFVYTQYRLSMTGLMFHSQEQDL